MLPNCSDNASTIALNAILDTARADSSTSYINAVATCAAVDTVYEPSLQNITRTLYCGFLQVRGGFGAALLFFGSDRVLRQ